MQPRPLNRMTRSALAMITLVLALGVTTAPAFADPGDPSSASEAMDQYQKLTKQGEKLNQDYLGAKEDLKDKQDDLAKANDALKDAQQSLADARKQEGKFRDKVDDLATASYRGARFSQLSALLTGTSPEEYLDKASALNVLASENYGALHKLAAATKQATTAKKKAAGAKQDAQDATDAAKQLVSDIADKKKALESQKQDVKDALSKLTGQQRAALYDPGDMGVFIGPPGAANTALQAALSQRGTPYVWGGASPGGFDCSGLMVWSYGKAGINLPRRSQDQAHVGKPVSRSNLQPGDLVFYGNPAYHVGMYVGGGKMVDAPTSGQVVKVQPLGSNYSGARRVAG